MSFILPAALIVGAIVDPPTIALAAISLVALAHYRVNAAWLIAGGAIVGVVIGRLT